MFGSFSFGDYAIGHIEKRVDDFSAEAYADVKADQGDVQAGMDLTSLRASIYEDQAIQPQLDAVISGSFSPSRMRILSRERFHKVK